MYSWFLLGPSGGCSDYAECELGSAKCRSFGADNVELNLPPSTMSRSSLTQAAAAALPSLAGNPTPVTQLFDYCHNNPPPLPHPTHGSKKRDLRCFAPHPQVMGANHISNPEWIIHMTEPLFYIMVDFSRTSENGGAIAVRYNATSLGRAEVTLFERGPRLGPFH